MQDCDELGNKSSCIFSRICQTALKHGHFGLVYAALRSKLLGVRLLNKLQNTNTKIRPVLVVMIFVTIGSAMLLFSRASGFISSIEAEKGSLSGSVSECSDTTASGGKCVKFGSSDAFTRILVLGDMVCANDPPTEKTCYKKEVADKIKSLVTTGSTKPEYIIMAGDIAYSQGSGTQFGLDLTPCGYTSTGSRSWSHPVFGNAFTPSDNFLDLYHDVLSSVKVLPAPGNHEYYSVAKDITYNADGTATITPTKGGPASCKFRYTGNNQDKLCDKKDGNCMLGWRSDPLWPYFQTFRNELLDRDDNGRPIMQLEDIDDTGPRKTYYSLNVGGWHVVSYDTACSPEMLNRAETYPYITNEQFPLYSVGTGQKSTGNTAQDYACKSSATQQNEQYNWIKNELENSPKKRECTIAFGHRPYLEAAATQTSTLGVSSLDEESEDYSYYASGSAAGAYTYSNKTDAEQDEIWKLLYDNKVDILLGGHYHNYYRYHNINRTGTGLAGEHAENGRQKNNGIEEFVIGAGGAKYVSTGNPVDDFLAAKNTLGANQGFLQLDLYNDRAEYKYIGLKTELDAGTVYCHSQNN